MRVWPNHSLKRSADGRPPGPGLWYSVLAVAVTAVAAAMLGAAFMATRRLWFGIGIHFGWKFVLGTVLSSAASGHKSEGLLQGQLVGPDWFTGGAYGLEASLAGLLAVSLGSALLIALVLKRGEVVLPYWKRSGDPNAGIDVVAAGHQL